MKNKDGSLNTENRSQTVAFIWSITDLLCGNFKQSKYSSVILPFTLLRRPECVLQPTGHKVLDPTKANADKTDSVRDKLLLRATDQQFFKAKGCDL